MLLRQHIQNYDLMFNTFAIRLNHASKGKTFLWWENEYVKSTRVS